ncbi:MAG: tripartite tricarboxylate transporter permease [Desulfovibrionaceae bacterium]|jgi:putative tricarboxylic transport membrane protein|nr:tripartite tricarboxylate transporter permease [Desulfovibrionaceae bacterium]
MELLHNILTGMDMLLQWQVLFSAAGGVLAGVVMGAIPGLSDIIAICLMVPFTYYLNPVAGLAMLMGLSKGANFGGAIPSILLNIPGTPQAVITAFDGFPLTRQGKAGKALKAALYASCLADTLSDCLLFFFAAPVALAAIMVGPVENVAIVVFALTLVAVTSQAGPLVGIASMLFGLLLRCVGADPLTGAPRLAFGSYELSAGMDTVPMALGFFVISEIIWQFCEGKKAANQGAGPDVLDEECDEDHGFSWAEFKQCLPAIGRGTAIGSLIGALPGIGTTVGSYLSYVATKKAAKDPSRFGKGAIEGIAASEAGNNACNGPNLIPLITLGIPGNLAAALILGAFTMQGLTPGPMFMEQQAPMLYALFIVLFFSNFFTLGFGLLATSYVRKIVNFPRNYIYAAVLAFALVGTYIVHSNTFDLYYAFAFSIIGLACRKANIPMIPLLIAYILGASLELKIRQTLNLYPEGLQIFFTKPISVVFLAASFAAIGYTVYRQYRLRK